MNTNRLSARMLFKTGILLTIFLTVTGCGPGQFLGPTMTPTPTKTLAPTATNTPAPTPTRRLTQTPIPTPMGGGSQIAFSTNRDGNWEIYLMHSDGTQQTRLTTSWQSLTYSENPDGTKTYLYPVPSNWFPKLSPDGQLLLYWSYTEGEPPSTVLNWLLPDGSTGEFAKNIAPYTSFSPNGDKVAMTVYSGKNNMDIVTVATEGGKGEQLTNDPGKDYEPGWSPDGKTIAFVSERDGTPYIYLMDADGNNQRRLMKGDQPELEPAWSPDGTKIAFVLSESTTRTNIYIVNADGTGLRSLTNEVAGYNENPVWSPDGTMIAFWSDRTGNHEIFSIKIDGTGLVNLTNHPAADENPSWSK